MQSEAQQQHILFVLSHPPQSGSLAEDCLDAIMTAALLNQSVGLLFIGDGVYQLSESTWAARIQSLGDLAALDFYVAKQDSTTRQLTLEKFGSGTPVKELEGAELAALFDRYDRILSF